MNRGRQLLQDVLREVAERHTGDPNYAPITEQRATDMTKPRLLINNYSVWVEVSTSHGDKLEFVLHRAEERNEKEYGFYSSRLCSMVAEALMNSEAAIEETQSYGAESLRLCAQEWSEMIEALALVEDAVERWVRAYQIEGMT